MSKVYELATSLHNFAGDFFQNVFAYELDESGVASPFEYADALITQWISDVSNDYMALMGSDVILDFVSAKRIQSPGGPSATQIPQLSGGQAGLSISTGVALDIAWQTHAGTNRPGHTYLTGMEGGSIVGGQWNAGFLTAVDAFITVVLPPLTLAGGLGNAAFGVYSRKLAQFNVADHGVKKPKPTMLNKRTLPSL